MNGNPHRIEGPALISFTGGRTSAYMIKQMLDAYDGVFPPEGHPTQARCRADAPTLLVCVVVRASEAKSETADDLVSRYIVRIVGVAIFRLHKAVRADRILRPRSQPKTI
jgi:hypothetical protein